MALEILKSDQTLTLKGTTITFDTIYSRLELACFADGKSMQVAFLDYQSASTYTSGSSNIQIEEIPLNTTYDVDIAGGEIQSLQLAHEKAKVELEEKGFIVNIIDLPA